MGGATQGFSGNGLACVRGERVVFCDLEFAIGPGESLLLAGPNGSGKSSLLRLMAGLLPPAAGNLGWNGANVSDDADAHRARLHYVGHADAVKPVLSVRENVAFWARLRGADDPNAVDGALAHFGIEQIAAVPGRFLSSGQRRRTSLARLLAAPAKLWLLDEPAVGLDDAAMAALEAATKRHIAGGGVIVAATHGRLNIEAASPLRLDDFSAQGQSFEGMP